MSPCRHRREKERLAVIEAVFADRVGRTDSMTDGEKMLRLAETRIGEKYVNVCVPKNNKNWHGPWDCAEFMSWLVYQVGGFLYGCTDDNGDPALTEAYTGAWQTD